MGLDFSNDTTLYAAIGVGALIVLVVLWCCCCCCCRKRKKQNGPQTPPLAAVPARPSPPRQKQPLDSVEDPYTMMPTSPAVDAPRSATVMEHPPHYYNHHNAKVFDAPSVILQQTPPTEATIVTNSGGSGRSSIKSVDLMAIAEDPVIIASRLPVDTITPLVLLSRGGFGEVHKASYRGNIVAIKTLLPDTRRNLKQINSFFQEVKLMASLDHANIVTFIGVAWDSFSDLCVVTEYMDGGDLRAALNEFDRIGRPLGFDKQKATLALHIAHALTYMHSLQPVVLHRDLKSRNVLLNAAQNVAKLTDFGVSRERSDATMTGGVGTLLWMAPEVMAGERYDDKADVFSFGILLSEMDTYSLPYADVKARLAQDAGCSLPDTALLQRIMTGKVRVTFSQALRNDVRALGEACTVVDPVNRPTAAQVLYELQKIERTMASEITIVL